MPQDFDVFLSYNSKDRSAVIALAEALREKGLRVWFDAWELVPGRPWQEAIEESILSAHSVAVLVGSEGIGPWEEPEMRAALSLAVQRALPVIPVLLPRAPSRVDLPLFLQHFTWVDFREGFDGDNIDRLCWGITGIKPGASLASGAHAPTYKPSTVKPKLAEVFKTVGLPEFTYIEPTIYRKFSYAVRIPGKHIILEGPSGLGKTCLVIRALQELGYKKDSGYGYISARNKEGRNQITSLLAGTAGSGVQQEVTVIDDFHILPPADRREIADQMKVISDEVFTVGDISKYILIGIPAAAASLLYDAVDLGPRLATFKLGPATHEQLDGLIREGEARLGVRFRDREVIIAESNGSFQLCQTICHAICFSANALEAQDDVEILRYQIEDVREELTQELSDRYREHLLRFCKGTSWKVEKDSGYLAILASIARTPKSVVHLNEILLGSGVYGASVYKALGSIASVLSSESGGEALSRLLHYDSSIETFSIEDAAFRYYLNNVDLGGFLEALGVHDEDFLKQFPMPKSQRLPVTPIDDQACAPKNDAASKRRDVVFISYSHADAIWMERLRVHLAPLVKKGVLSIWSDTQIRAGSNWKAEINQAIAVARVAVLLVSANYLASDFVVEQELPLLLAKAQAEGLTVIWIPISSSAWQLTPISEYQPAQNPTKPLAKLDSATREEVLVRISKEIAGALNS
jgi:hypothetical protein